MDSSSSSDRVFRAVPRKRAIGLIFVVFVTLNGITEAAAGHWYGWVSLALGALTASFYVGAITVIRRPELRLTDTSVTLSMPAGRPRVYDLRHCGEFRAFSWFGIPPRVVTFYNSDSSDLIGRNPDLKRRFIPENRSIQSIFDISARDLAALLNEYRARALAQDEQRDPSRTS